MSRIPSDFEEVEPVASATNFSDKYLSVGLGEVTLSGSDK